jgi:hypothetical protein
MRNSLPITAIVLAALCALVVPELRGQAPTPTPTPPALPYAVVTYPSTQAVVSPSADGIFHLVGLQPDQLVQVTINCGADWLVGENTIETLDGGVLFGASQSSSKNISVMGGSDRKVSFSFQAKHNAGRNQLSIQQEDQELILQFWVLQTDKPEDNPRTITPENPTLE